MKKTIKSMLAMAVAAFTFAACSDVPAPYQIPGTGGGDEGSLADNTYLDESFSTGFGSFTVSTVAGTPWVIDFKTAKATGYADGTTTPSESYLVSKAIDLSQSEGAYLEFDYILRYVRAGQTENKVLVTANYTGDPTTTEWTDITGTLTEGSDWNTFAKYQADLPANMIGQSAVVIALYYKCTSTSATIEVKNLKLIEGKAGEGTEEADGNMPEGLAGAGTAENPYTVADAHKIIEKFGQTESPEVYLKGTVVSSEYSAQYGSCTYYISDDGSANNQLEVYAGKYFNKAKFTEANQLKAGDVVVIIGKLVNFKGNTPEVTNGNYLYSLNGETAGEEPETPDTPISGNNLLSNGDFETWEGGQPVNWKTASSAGNATLSQSSDARSGSYAVSIGFNATSNKRMGYKEITLKAGTYSFSFYAKSTTADKSQTEAGYVDVVNGTANSSGYKYGGYVDLNNTTWTQVSTTFTLSAETTVCLVVMNPKNSNYATAQNILVDDASLTTNDGGLADGSGNTDPTPQPSGSEINVDFKTNGQGEWVIQDVALPTGLNYVWSYDSRYGMKATAYYQKDYAAESWVISPALDLSSLSTATLTIKHASNYFAGSVADECAVMISTDYTSGAPSTGTWEAVTVSTWPTSWTFVEGTADLSKFAGKNKVYVAFKYTSTTKAGTWEIESINIK